RKNLEIFLDETGKMAKVGGWEYSLINDQLYWTPETYRIHELDFDRPITVHEGINYYHPDYRDKIQQVINSLIETGERYDIKAKIVTAKNNVKWVRTIGYGEWKGDRLIKIKGTFQDITTQQETYEKLQAREKQYRELVNTAQDIIYRTDREGYLVFINAIGPKVTGYSEEELLGMYYLDMVDPEYRAEAVNWYKQQAKNKQSTSYLEFPIITKQGHRKWIGQNVQLSIINEQADGFTAIARDITEIKQAEEQLKQTSSRLETLIENLHAGVLVENQEGQVVLANQHFCDLFYLNCSNKDLIGYDCKDLIGKIKDQFANSDQFIEDIGELIQYREKKVSEELGLKDGRTIERNFIPINYAEENLGHLWQYRDISNRKEEEQELLKAKEEAEKASKAKADF
ncbi:MAG: hypothetical protein BRD49_01985, partial [Bacteroidetes bacterium SW_10_40_5]